MTLATTRPSVGRMFAVVLAFLLVLPFIEIWAVIAVADAIGWPLTLLAVVGSSVAGVLLLRREGTTVWRKANAEMAAGRAPTRQLLDGALILIGGVCLVLPGFVTGAFGALLLLPPVRAIVRPLLLAWMTRRAARLARSGHLRGVMVDTVVGPDGRVRTRTRTVGDVIDADGWDVGEDPSSLPVAGPHPDVIEGHLADTDEPGRPGSGRSGEPGSGNRTE